MSNTGLVYVFTGEGKGKTSAALGVATRSLLLGKRVVWVALYKQRSWGLSEAKLQEKFSNLEMYFGGKGFRIGRKTAPVGTAGHVVVDTASEEEHKLSALETFARAQSSLASQPFLLVIDEVLNAVSDGLIDIESVIVLLEKRRDTHILLTGRGATSELVKRVDLVTECKKIKHPYDTGRLAVAGLDF